MTDPFDRRTFSLAGAALASLLFLPAASRAAAAKPRITTYRSPSCGCCAEWIEKARAAGFDVTDVPTADIYALKAKHGVPEELISCHTSLIGGYVVEGHVPFDAMRRLLARRPQVKGIGVAGMPLGSPGMQAPDGRKQPFKVMAFDTSGKVSVF